MAVGAGLSASFGIAAETTFGTPVPVTRFVEFNSTTLKGKTTTVQGAGLRQGGLVERAGRRMLVAREAAGDVVFEPTTNGMGLFLQYMLGSTPGTPTALTGAQAGLYQQIHNVGSLTGKSFTTQVVKPDTTGALNPFTYPGCKITDWDLSVAADKQVDLKLTIDAIDEATASNTFAGTTLSANVTQGASTISTVAALPAGAYVTIDTGLAAETVQTVGAATGSGPYVSTLVAPTAQAHQAGVYVGSATGINYGTAAALQTASYNAGTSMFGFQQGQLIVGGTTATTGGIYTNTGGAAEGVVRSISIQGKNALATKRPQLGSLLRAEQIDNGWRQYTADVEVEFNSRAAYDRYISDQAVALSCQFVGAGGATLAFYAPAAFQEDGGQPDISNPDIIVLKQKYKLLDDGTNGALQFVYTSTDNAI